MINAAGDDQEKRWERARQIGHRPVRLLHRGGVEPKDSESLWLAGERSFAYGVDSCATAVVRLGVTPMSFARMSSRRGRKVGGTSGALVGGLAGFFYGMPRGLLGAGVSVCTAAACFYVAPIAELVGVAFCVGDGIRRGALATDRLFTGPERGERRPAAAR